LAVDAREAIARGREDVEFFAFHFCSLKLHEGEIEWLQNAVATINLLLTGNRWGKTTTLGVRHLHCQFYKLGAEPRYMNPDGTIDRQRFLRERYLTVHTAGLYETAEMVWNEIDSLVKNNQNLQPWLETPLPRSKPHEIRFLHNGRWYFRTLGDNGEGIDGKSFYLITIDEAGWEQTIKAQAYLGDERQLDHSGATKRNADGSRPVVDPAVVKYGKAAGYDIEAMMVAYLARVAKQRELDMEQHAAALALLAAS
jgi:hypothetical protein